MKRIAVSLLLIALATMACAYDQPAISEGDGAIVLPPKTGMMGRAGLAAWDGNVYLLAGDMLHKLNANMRVVKSVQLPATAELCPMGEGCPMCRASGHGRGCGMRGAGMLAADAKGVYLVRAGTVTAFDHALQEIGSAALPQEQVVARCCPRGLGVTPIPPVWDGTMEQRASQPIPGGRVVYNYPPTVLDPGTIRVELVVLDEAGNADLTATINAFLYPIGRPGAGRSLSMKRTSRGDFRSTASGSGGYELAVRVMRPGRDDALTYFLVTID